MTHFSHRISPIIAIIIATLALVPALTYAAETPKTVYRINDVLSLYVLPFTLTHDSYAVVAPKNALRDLTSSSSLTYIIKTPEGLRVKDGHSVAALTRDDATGNTVLYVLYEKVASSSRANTVSVTALPFGLVSSTGTTTTELRAHELKPFTLSDDKVKQLEDSE